MTSGDRNFQKGHFDNAYTDYAEFVSREPGNPQGRLKLARTLVKIDRAPEAVEHATLARDQHPMNEEYIETLAMSLHAAHRQDQCIQLVRGIADSRGLAGDYIRLGRYLHKSGDADGAEQALKQGARVDGGKTIAPQMALADFYHDIGDKTSEVKRLRMALFIEPNNPEIAKRLRALGEIPGPSLALTPEELGTP
jgi:predicted Zn-dependent protease